ncbi:MAG: hypothetical protein MUD11_05415 [Rhodobacteraceae bacterium]|nr:hypothetical protein [Paracoccaceae bacterium]
MDEQILTVALPVAMVMLALVPKLIGLIVRLRRSPDEGAIGTTLLGRVAGPLPGDLGLIARIGMDGPARASAGAQVLRTTLGLRVISLGLSGVILALLLGGGFHGAGFTGQDGALALGLGAFLAVGMLDILTYELQVDRYGMVLTRFIFWRRSFDWTHLMGIDDDQNYYYVLAFRRGGRVKVLKHLVGMPGFLTLVRQALERNKGTHAGTSGS